MLGARQPVGRCAQHLRAQSWPADRLRDRPGTPVASPAFRPPCRPRVHRLRSSACFTSVRAARHPCHAFPAPTSTHRARPVAHAPGRPRRLGAHTFRVAPRNSADLGQGADFAFFAELDAVFAQTNPTPLNCGSFTRLFAESFPYGIVNN